MPRATVKTDVEHKELKSCEGGWVDLRQLPFHDMLIRRDKSTNLSMEMSNGKAKDDEARRMGIEMANLWTAQFEFANCIVDHNLEDDEGNKLDFSEKAVSKTLRILDPKIGSEIERYIDELNQEEDDLEDFTKRPSSFSENGQTLPNEGSDGS